jgi:hypothetical protein
VSCLEDSLPADVLGVASRASLVVVVSLDSRDAGSSRTGRAAGGGGHLDGLDALDDGRGAVGAGLDGLGEVGGTQLDHGDVPGGGAALERLEEVVELVGAVALEVGALKSQKFRIMVLFVMDCASCWDLRTLEDTRSLTLSVLATMAPGLLSALIFTKWVVWLIGVDVLMAAAWASTAAAMTAGAQRAAA